MLKDERCGDPEWTLQERQWKRPGKCAVGLAMRRSKMRKTRHHSKPERRCSSICGVGCRGYELDHSWTWWLDGGPLARVNRVFGNSIES